MSTIKISIPEEEIKEESAENISVDKIQVDESIVKITTDENTPAINQPILTINKTPYIRMNVAVGILAAIALVAALYLAHAFFVPLLIGILASYTLSPVVEWLKKWYIPRAIGAALVLVVLIGSLSWIIFALSDDTLSMIEKLPDAARKLRQNLSDVRTAPTARQNMQETAKEIEGAASDAGDNPGRRITNSRTNEPTAWLRDYAVAKSALLFTFVSQAPIVLLLTYFLLASGTHFRYKLVQFVGPSQERKKDTTLILDEINIQIQRILLTMLISNVMVGIGTWLDFAALGLEHAAVCGVAAGVLHSVPYLGPASISFSSGMAAFLQFESIFHALGAAGASLLVAGLIGFIFLPWIQSRFAGVNAAVLFVALLFFAWMWGVWGLLLGAPLVAIAKVICDRVESLKSVGELLGR